MRPFGTEEYGSSSGFSIRCNLCGREGDVVPIHVYESVAGELTVAEIKLELRCSCGNKYGAVIDKSKQNK